MNAASARTGSAFDLVLDSVGRAIVNGEHAAGAVLTTEDLIARTDCSRSIVREATRVLSGMGMLSSRPHVGSIIRPDADWDWLNPQLLRWALLGERRMSTMSAIREFRLATEPESARLAAVNRLDQDAIAMRDAATAIFAAGKDSEAFLAADLEFHRLIRVSAGNPLLDRVGSAIDEALRDRASHLAAHQIDDHDVRLHIDVAIAIEHREKDLAAAAMREIIGRT